MGFACLLSGLLTTYSPGCVFDPDSCKLEHYMISVNFSAFLALFDAGLKLLAGAQFCVDCCPRCGRAIKCLLLSALMFFGLINGIANLGASSSVGGSGFFLRTLLTSWLPAKVGSWGVFAFILLAIRFQVRCPCPLPCLLSDIPSCHVPTVQAEDSGET